MGINGSKVRRQMTNEQRNSKLRVRLAHEFFGRNLKMIKWSGVCPAACLKILGNTAFFENFQSSHLPCQFESGRHTYFYQSPVAKSQLARNQVVNCWHECCHSPGPHFLSRAKLLSLRVGEKGGRERRAISMVMINSIPAESFPSILADFTFMLWVDESRN